ncbi:nitronate monooxygenase [Paenibacillus sp. FSL R5-0623]|uniref:nitronate monooxygenase n=1 Tax=Paenibacillus sp. FSL R5-0623 TaxID=2921651 RepID=UPI0030D86F53
MANRVCEILDIKKPIIQGPMSWVTNAELVAAISNAVGLVFLGPNAGQVDTTRSPERSAERMRTEIQKNKSLTNKPFGIPLIVNRDLAYTWPLIETVIDEKVPVVLVNDTLDERIFKPLKENNMELHQLKRLEL